MTKSPLAWPSGWKRTRWHERKRARFFKSVDDGSRHTKPLSIHQGTARVLNELRSLGVLEGDSIISTNLKLRLDGFPRSDQKEPDDPGVAVYWERSNESRKVMGIDLYDRIADNLAAIAATLNAMRAIERHGGALILERAFTGFDALPDPGNWRHTLGIDEKATLEDAKGAYRRQALKSHPDKGGSDDLMDRLTKAWSVAQKELG